MVRGRGVLRGRIDRNGARSGSGTSAGACDKRRGSSGSSQPAPAVAPQGVIVEQVLVKVNGDIITKTELEERQIAALRERKVSPEVLKNDEQLKKALADVTPMLLVNAIDELLVVQLARKGPAPERRAVQSLADVDAKGSRARGRQEVRAGAAAGRHGSHGHPPQRREAVSVAAGADRGVWRQASDYGRRGTAVLPGEPERVHRARYRHAARDPHRSADDDAAGPDDGERRQG